MRKLLMLGSLMALLVPTASHAQFQVGARLGFAPVMGNEAKDAPMSDGIKSQIPIQIEGAYKLTRDAAVGAYVSYGLGQLSSDFCPSGATCSSSDVRVGLQALYTFNQVKAPLVPWAGIGLGYELANFKAEAGGVKVEGSDGGYELNLQLGGDYSVNEKFAVGPYVMLSVGQYQSAEVKVNGATIASGSIDEKATHEWFGFGVRGKFDL
jgi:Outer membrane protein beta-barrel domain